MDWAYKASLTATTVALLIAVGKLFGRRVAGLLAGLPTVTGPALIWLAVDHGAAYAVEASIGSIAACVLCAGFALAYERASRHAGVLMALFVACIATLLFALPLQMLAANLALACIAAVAASTLVCAAMPRETEKGLAARPKGELWMTALVAGAVSAVVGAIAPHVGSFWAGVIASPPLIAAVVASHQHIHDGPAAARWFLRGYVSGLLGRTLFTGLFALLLVPLGMPLAAALAALSCAAFALAAAQQREDTASATVNIGQER